MKLISSKYENYIEKKRFLHSLVFPTFFLVVIWTVKVFEIVDDLDLTYYGVFPRKIAGLTGIITSPFIHGNMNHIIDNSIPLFFLSLAIFYFYNKVAYRVFIYSWFFTGITVWLFARPAYHIGASSLIYGFGSFLFFSGIIRQNINLLAISLLVTFLYGSMVWGIFPYKYGMSWESHLFGGISGFLLSFVYRKQGPVAVKQEWDEEEDEDEPGKNQMVNNDF